jgi:hypothetical protein
LHDVILLLTVKKEREMRVFIVLEEDRGLGPMVAGVFASLAAAEWYLEGPEGSNCYIYSPEGEEVQE